MLITLTWRDMLFGKSHVFCVLAVRFRPPTQVQVEHFCPSRPQSSCIYSPNLHTLLSEPRDRTLSQSGASDLGKAGWVRGVRGGHVGPARQALRGACAQLPEHEVFWIYTPESGLTISNMSFKAIYLGWAALASLISITNDEVERVVCMLTDEKNEA